MELVPEVQREPMRQQLEALLGPTALEPLDDEELAADDVGDDFDDDDGAFADALGDPSGFQLGSSLLGEGDTTMAPGLLGGSEEEGGPALMLGDPGSFSLGGGGSSSSMLRLNLGGP